MDLIDVTRVVTRRHGWLSIESEEPVRDLHVTIDAGIVDFRATVVPGPLRVRGLSPSQRVRLNGREFIPGWSANDMVLVSPAAWH